MTMRLGFLSLALFLMLGPLANAAQTPSGLVVDFLGWSGGAHTNYWQQKRELTFNLDQADPAQIPAKRLDFARFYLAHDDAPEALGMLSAFGADREAPAEVVLYRGIAEKMQGRPDAALRHLADSRLVTSNHARLWRGLIEADRRNWLAARDLWPGSDEASRNYTRQWQGRFIAARIETALGLGDLDSVHGFLDLESGTAAKMLDPLTRLLFQGRMRQAEGGTDMALVDFGKVAEQADSGLAAEARFRFLALKLSADRAEFTSIRPEFTALAPLIDTTPVAFDYHLLMARLSEQDGDSFTALSHLRIARDRPPTRRLGRTTGAAIESLMLSALGPGIDQGHRLISQVRGFYQVHDLLPVGNAGDRIVSAHAERLAALDLLGPAEELLAYQVAERLSGTDRARAALRLAEIRLALGRPSLARLSAGLAGHSRLGHRHRIRLSLIKAKIFAAIGDLPRALGFLEGLDWDPAVMLKADLNLRQGNGDAARKSYRRLLANLSVRGVNPDQSEPLSEERIVRRLALASALTGLVSPDASLELRFIADQFVLPEHPSGDDISRFANLEHLSAMTQYW